MALKLEHENLIFPSGKIASEIYACAIKRAKADGIPQWQALNQAAMDHGMQLAWDSALVALSEQVLIDEHVADHGEPELIHSLGVQIAKMFFLNKEGKPVEVSEPLNIEQAAQFGLMPLVIVSLSVEGASLHRAQLLPYQAELNIAPALVKLWSSCAELLGVPNSIKISKVHERLVAKLERLFVGEAPVIVIANGNDRRHTANINANQNLYFYSSSPITTLENINQCLLPPSSIGPAEFNHNKKGF